MQTKKINLIFENVLKRIEPPQEELDVIKSSVKDFLEKVGKKIKNLKIDAEVFVGGSFAKNTLIKKDYYDVDVFIRFDKKYKDEEISKLTEEVLKEFVNVSVIHGSRDYFRIKGTKVPLINPSFKIGVTPDQSVPIFFIEVVPVKKVKTPKESQNITDLSYSHVKYIKKKIKSEKILDEIKLAKVFCYANNCYGAESYVGGFSGYGLELLVYYYGSFLKFVKAMIKAEEKIIIDIEKHYKNKSAVLMDVNSSKLNSPIVLIDPTYKQRNALAALSEETFEKFKKVCEKFLKNPCEEFFEVQKTDLKKVKKDAEKRKNEFILLEVKTEKQEGDIAGTKLLKFYNHLEKEIERFFEVKKKGFNYNGKKSARYFFVVKKKKDILFNGPNVNDKKNLGKFKKRHKNVFVKKNKVYAREKIDFSLREFVQKWKIKNKKKIREMSVEGIRRV